MNTIWNNLPKPFFVLAPMEAVTDVVFRHVVARAGRPDLFMTEFTNAASYCSPKGAHSTRGRLAFTADEQPIIAQIWGNNPEQFRQMSIGLRDAGFAGIDINMGCPDKSVVKQGSGSGLICNPGLAAELIAAAKESGLPVSVKTRLGYSSTDEWRDWLTHILRQDIVNLTIHLRTRKEMSKVDAHFELIPEIKKLRDEIAPQTLLTINGDIRDRAHGLELVETYGVDGIMIGRGIFKNPYAFARSGTLLPFSKKPVDSSTTADLANNIPTSRHLQPERALALAQGEPGVKPSEKWGIEASTEKTNLLSLLNLHLDLHEKYSSELEPRAFEPLKRFFKVYLHSFPGAGELRAKLMQTKSIDEVRAILAETTDAYDGEDPQHVDAPGGDQ